MEQEALKLVEVLNANRMDNADVKRSVMTQAVSR
jgi:hypothetical protein